MGANVFGVDVPLDLLGQGECHREGFQGVAWSGGGLVYHVRVQCRKTIGRCLCGAVVTRLFTIMHRSNGCDWVGVSIWRW